MVSDARIRLFHGTTAAAAERILTEGFRSLDHAEVLRDVSSRHDVAVADLEENLRNHSSYLVTEKDRGTRVSFTPKRENVESTWAQHAPEALREALWAVWRVKLSTVADPFAWHTDVEGHAFVLEQLAGTEPVILELVLGREQLLDLGAQVVSFAAGPLTAALLNVVDSLPEIAFRLPFQPPVEMVVHPMERRVGWDVFTHWLGMDLEEFRKRDGAGEFGPSGIGRFHVQPWWPLAQVDDVLERFGCR